MTKEYLDLKLDFMFKQLFGQPSRKHITIAFLNDLLGRTNGSKITDLTFENNEIIKDMVDGKSARLDFLVLTAVGERINVEIQVVNQHDMPERILYYWAKTYSSSIHSGQPYTMLKPTIMISILNYPLFPSETDLFHTIFHIKEDTDHFLWSEYLEFHVFDLSTFMVQWKKYRRQMKNQEKNTELPWLIMLTASDYRKKKTNSDLLLELEEWAMDKERVREALIEWETLSANKENRTLYDAKAKELRDLLSNLEGERRKGKEEGIIEGIKEGKQKGKLEEKQEIALKMLEEGLNIALIAKITKLSEVEIEKLRFDR
ncbi:Rpn family recombination-promoting nuclease/putative transposase [Bacillus sp. Marseille-P3661]|uniref:Rpn family recombination-promoting nuclease/putative transposase n=1 Tax=Bacillus sp. Marseille-P3661 TaxID=1936234 RepID=UPI000C8577CB|nr:Rpn family recombination-promoting nuclease/putative transposase [Bacillus sp. Marseille-P3661]